MTNPHRGPMLHHHVWAFVRFPLSVVAVLAAVACATPESHQLGWDMRHSDDGRLESMSNARGHTISFDPSTDNEGRLRAMRTHVSGEAPIAEVYDQFERLERIENATGVTSYRYDGQHRVVSIENSDGFRLGYEYDGNGRVVSVAMSGGWTVEYTYDFLGRLVEIALPAGEIRYEYRTKDGQVVRTLPNGITSTFTYRPDGFLNALDHVDAEDAVLAQYRYEFEPGGRLRATRELTSDGERRLEYRYDAAGRLVEVDDSSHGASRFAYDTLGNRVLEERGDVSTRGEYDWSGRLRSWGDTVLMHDADGNVTARGPEGTPPVEYTYSAESLLTRIEQDQSTVEYAYDGFGRMVHRTVANHRTRFFVDATDDWRPLMARADEGPPTHYIWGEGLVGHSSPTGVEFYLEDALGSVRLVVGEAGETRARYDYLPFGMAVSNSSTTAPETDLSPGFVGLFYDANAGLHLTTRRAYDPAVGRFLQRDPAFTRLVASADRASLNPYEYSWNDPVNFVDRNGLYAVRPAPLVLSNHNSLSGAPRPSTPRWEPPRFQSPRIRPPSLPRPSFLPSPSWPGPLRMPPPQWQWQLPPVDPWGSGELMGPRYQPLVSGTSQFDDLDKATWGHLMGLVLMPAGDALPEVDLGWTTYGAVGAASAT